VFVVVVAADSSRVREHNVYVLLADQIVPIDRFEHETAGVAVDRDLFSVGHFIFSDGR